VPLIFLLEQKAEDVPWNDDWLDPSELRIQSGLRFAKRRSDWRLGHWTAKKLIAGQVGMPAHPASLASIRIEHAPLGRPIAVLPEGESLASISISHSCGSAFCALTFSSVRLGCDLERIESRDQAFIDDYFTPWEQALVAQSPAPGKALLATLLWSAKESALKALGVGLRLDTRTLALRTASVSGTPEGRWSAVEMWFRDSKSWPGWWSYENGFVRTLVCEPLTPVSARGVDCGSRV
jgi:4'-phosphopantetheinyl transferase